LEIAICLAPILVGALQGNLLLEGKHFNLSLQESSNTNMLTCLKMKKEKQEIIKGEKFYVLHQHFRK